MKRSDIILHIDNTIGVDNTLESVVASKKDDVMYAYVNASTNEFIVERTNQKLAKKTAYDSYQQHRVDKNVIDIKNHISDCHIQEPHFYPKKTSLQHETISNLFICSSEFNRRFTPRISLNTRHHSHIARRTLQIYFKLLQFARDVYIATCWLLSRCFSFIIAVIPHDCSLFPVKQLPAVFCSLWPPSPTKDEIRIQTAGLRHGPPPFSSL